MKLLRKVIATLSTVIMVSCLSACGDLAHQQELSNSNVVLENTETAENNKATETTESGDDMFTTDGSIAPISKNENTSEEIAEEETMIMTVSDGTYEVVFQLNDSSASKDLYTQLPIDIEVEDYSINEKIFYPEPLDTSDTPLLESGSVGTLAYFAPWDDVVMYYSRCGAYSGLYVLGEAISGADNISNLSGTIHIK